MAAPLSQVGQRVADRRDRSGTSVPAPDIRPDPARRGTARPAPSIPGVRACSPDADARPPHDPGTRPFAVDPWQLRETGLDPAGLGRAESVFALSNGHIGLRGTLDEGEPHAAPGTYLNAFHECRPLPAAERGPGDPASGQTVVDATDGTVVRLLVDGRPFDVRYGSLDRHERTLDLRAGTLSRVVEWRSPSGRRVRVRSERLVSLTVRALAAIHYEVEVLDGPALVAVRSELVAGARGGALLPRAHQAHPAGATLVHTTRSSGLTLVAATDHLVRGPVGTAVASEATEDLAHTTALVRLEPGQTLRLVKLVAYGWSSCRSPQALRDQAHGALAAGSTIGWTGLLADQRAYLDAFWRTADVELDGDAELQQAVRLALFHLLQAGARAEGGLIGARGLTGAGDEGHASWETEGFCLPVLSHLLPPAAADALRRRHTALPQARRRARDLGLSGAAFASRTIDGAECAAHRPAFHVNAAVADAVLRHVAATADTQFERTVGLDLLVATARLWLSLGHHDDRGEFRIDGVVGPDGYTAAVDDDVYTNLMAQQNLLAAADTAARYPREAQALGVAAEEAAAWRDAAKNVRIPYDPRLGVHPQSEGFTRHQPFGFAATGPERYPLREHVPAFDLVRRQVVEQADVVLAMARRPECFTPEQTARNFAYYEAVTVRDSPVSACSQAVVAARTGHLDLAHDYLAEAALVDLHDLTGTTAHGMHIPAMAGTWTAVVAGFGGMRVTGDAVGFAPRLPAALARISFGLRWRGSLLRVEARHDGTVLTLLDGPELTVRHHGEPVRLRVGVPVRRTPPEPDPAPEPVEQPPGRAPRPRHRASGLRR